jgi:hypothetical protein
MSISLDRRPKGIFRFGVFHTSMGPILYIESEPRGEKRDSGSAYSTRTPPYSTRTPLYSTCTPLVLRCTPLVLHSYSACTPLVLRCSPLVLRCTPLYSAFTPLVLHSYSPVLHYSPSSGARIFYQGGLSSPTNFSSSIKSKSVLKNI